MLIPFVIEPDAYKVIEGRSPAEKKHSVDELLNFWHDHGVLVVPAGYDWYDCLKKLDHNQRGRLEVAYKSELIFRKRNKRQGEICWDELQSPADAIRYADQLDIGLFILEPTRASEIGLPEPIAEPCAHPNGDGLPEITLWHHANDTCGIANLRVLAQKRIQPWDTPQTIWEERLRGYAEYSKHIVIADRYAARGLSRDRQPSKALPFLLNHLMGSERKNGKPFSLSVFSTYDDTHDASSDDSFAQIKSKIEQVCDGNVNNPNIAKIDFYLLSEVHHGQKFHERWIRFDNNVIVLGKGLEMLEPIHYGHRNDSLSLEFGLKHESAVSDIRRDEKTLESYCKGFEHFRIPT